MMREIYIRPSWLVIVLILLTIIIFAFDYSAEPLQYEDNRMTSLLTPEELTIDHSQFPNAEQNQKCFQPLCLCVISHFSELLPDH